MVWGMAARRTGVETKVAVADDDKSVGGDEVTADVTPAPAAPAPVPARGAGAVPDGMLRVRLTQHWNDYQAGGDGPVAHLPGEVLTLPEDRARGLIAARHAVSHRG